MEVFLGYIIPAVFAIYIVYYGYLYIKSRKDPNSTDSIYQFWKMRHFGKPLSKEQKEHLDKIQEEAELPQDYVDSLKDKE